MLKYHEAVELTDFWQLVLNVLVPLSWPGTVELADFWKVRYKYQGTVELADF